MSAYYAASAKPSISVPFAPSSSPPQLMKFRPGISVGGQFIPSAFTACYNPESQRYEFLHWDNDEFY
jgi:hypothetical protein